MKRGSQPRGREIVRSWAPAILVHVAIGILLFFGASFQQLSPKASPGRGDQQKPIEATVVSQSDYERARKELEAANMQKAQRLKALREQAAKAVAERKEAEEKLASLAKKNQSALQQSKAQANMLNKNRQDLSKMQEQAKQLAVEREKTAKELAQLKTQAAAAKKQREVEQEKLAKLKAAAKAQARARAEARKRAAERAEARRKAALQRQIQEAQTAHDQRVLGNWEAAIRQAVERNWNRPGTTPANLNCMVRVTLLPNGQVTQAKMVSCNGSEVVTQSILTAVNKASPLPLPSDPSVFQRNITFQFKPG